MSSTLKDRKIVY